MTTSTGIYHKVCSYSRLWLTLCPRELPVPIVNITEHSRRRTLVKGSGQEDVFVPVDKSLVYNSSRGMRIYVYSDSRHSP